MLRLSLKAVFVFSCITLSASFTGFNAGAAENTVNVSTTVDKPIVGIGGKIKYIISVSLSKDADVEFPAVGQTLGKFSIKDSGFSRKDSFRKKILTQWYSLETYIPGEYTIPSTTVRYKSGKDTDWETTEVSEVKVEVKSVLKGFPKASDIRDIKGPVAFPEKIIFYMLKVLAVLILLSWVVSAIKRRGLREKHVMPKLPHEVAYERFEELKRKGLIASGKIKEFYIELSDIVRRYLEDRFGLKAPEMTTEEFLQRVKTTEKLDTAQKNLLREFLSRCDLVKFAKYGPEQGEIESSFESAVRLVDQTKEEKRPASQIKS